MKKESKGRTAESVTNGIDATGLIAIVTGGTSGVGLETARVLALRGAYVFIAARNYEKYVTVKQKILDGNPEAQIDYLEMDLANLASVRKAAAEFLATKLPLNILINNAGIMMTPYRLSTDGIEMQFATNYLGHWLFTNLLLGKMKESAETGIQGRIVNVASSFQLSYRGCIRFDNLNDKGGYSPYYAYGQSKIATILHAKELTAQLEKCGANVTINACHPGATFSGFQRALPRYLTGAVKLFSGILWKTPAQGAATQCFLALSPTVSSTSGEYFCSCKEAEPAEIASDPQLAKKLWDFTVNLTCTAQAYNRERSIVVTGVEYDLGNLERSSTPTSPSYN
ncbi:hypothetical protein R1flu_001884 [Riccia fluitans]|uniref:Short-chain dehydrogenase n=1 Tax=Riccia fluitans TaxID=41844 RepID=A0ABD1Y8I0_9MARC